MPRLDIAIFCGTRQNGKEHHSDFEVQFANALRQEGHHARLLDWEEDAGDAVLSLTIGGALLPARRLARGRRPHVHWIIDDPIESLLLDQDEERLSFLTVDRQHDALLQGLGGTSRFLPLGQTLQEMSEQADMPRPFGVTFIGDVEDPDQIRNQWNQLSSNLAATHDGLVSACLSDLSTPVITHWSRLMAGTDLDENTRVALFRNVDAYLHRHKLCLVLRALEGINLHIFGEVGVPDIANQDNLTVHPIPRSSQQRVILAQSRIALNLSPNFHDGCHPSSIAPLSYGTLPLTDGNPFLKSIFRDKVELLFYDFSKIDELKEKVSRFLKKEERRTAVVKRGRELIASSFSWEQRASEAIPYFESLLPDPSTKDDLIAETTHLLNDMRGKLRREIMADVRQFILAFEGSKLRDIDFQLKLAGAQSTARFVLRNMPKVPTFKDRPALLQFALSKVSLQDGLFLEFGVFKGDTIRQIATTVGPATAVYGFDSFEGLPENWRTGFGKGVFKVNELPEVPDNVTLVKGWFHKTLPQFHQDQLPYQSSFIHVDCDLYSSTKTVFEIIGETIVPGTILVFDEYFNYPGWEEGEHKAFVELIESRNLSFSYIGYTKVGEQVAVQIHSVSTVETL